MNSGSELRKKILSASSETFAVLALAMFHYQARHNQVYKNFLQAINFSPATVHDFRQIPFLPIELFKTQKVLSDEAETGFYFESSGTTHQVRSKHFVSDIELYKQSAASGFSHFYGTPTAYCFIALLPSYLERQHTSLVFMCNHLMSLSGHCNNGFYLDDFETLNTVLYENEKRKIKTILIGVTYALLDFAEQYPMPLQTTMIMETGGMKGRREEITREELHERLKKAFQCEAIHSEYGMTELLSQAYAKKNGIFFTPPWMQVLIRDPEDPFTLLSSSKTGCINIIDLANLYSCSFIATQDLGKRYADGSFEVLGRYDNSEIRGCNLLVV
jgi:hypothetical protein